MTELQEGVARSADTADLHATVPTLLLELQTLLGSLTSTVTDGTERGRRPFRPGTEWAPRLGELAYGVFLLADQTGVDLATAVHLTATQLEAKGRRAQQQVDTDWPFEG
ncbi:hypothetical protein [Jatrophihabitans endophyticus]|uniref:hypothetical protein n=1 Tax=Jatrophihabitans endophyticus TaxID=1206085 RepID=UPI001A0C21A9|nr:hypothetical protein [Jatrophihabitans endophyticus]MBE7187038.1 hypothetical protein [Jatrophihabitans endophyticus]